MIRTITEHFRILASGYVPSGKAWNAKFIEGTNFRSLLEALAVEFHRMDVGKEAFMNECMPDTTNDLIHLWESALGIPDDCFPNDGSIQERRDNVKRKLARLHLQTRTDYEAFAAGLGYEIKCRSGIEHDTTGDGYGTELPVINVVLDKRARATIVITFLSGVDPVGFAYDFAFGFEDLGQNLLQCVFEQAAPAHCILQYVVI